MKKITIAIDGHSSCGKSTMAKDLAREVGYVYVDTGAMYRSVTLYALRKHLFNEDGSVKTAELEDEMSNIRISFKFNPETGRPDTYLNGERVEDEIRSLEVSNHVSPIAAVPFVRTAMVAQQQQMVAAGLTEAVRHRLAVSGGPVDIRGDEEFRCHRKIARIPQPLSVSVGWGGIAPPGFGIVLHPPFG